MAVKTGNTPERDDRPSGGLSLRDGLQALTLQGLGPVSYLGLILILSRVWGPEIQGSYAHAKAWLDFVVAFGAFGLSQGMTYVIHRHDASALHLMRIGVYVGAFALATLLTIGALSLQRTMHSLLFTDYSSVFLLSIAGAAGILMNLWRGILLTRTDGPAFSWSFVVQPLALLAIVCMTAVAAWTLHLPKLFAMTYCGGLLFVGLFLVRSIKDSARTIHATPKVGTLVSASLQAFIQNAAVALAPFASIWMLQYHGASLADIGIWSVAMAMFQIIGSPVAMVAPILFSRWAAGKNGSSLTQADNLASHLFLWSLLPTIGLCICSYYLVPVAFGVAFSPASRAASVFAATMPFVMISRIIAPLMFAIGSPGTLSILYVIRLIVVILVGGFLLSSDITTSFIALAISWLIAETVISAIAWLWLKRQILRR